MPLQLNHFGLLFSVVFQLWSLILSVHSLRFNACFFFLQLIVKSANQNELLNLEKIKDHMHTNYIRLIRFLAIFIQELSCRQIVFLHNSISSGNFFHSPVCDTDIATSCLIWRIIVLKQLPEWAELLFGETKDFQLLNNNLLNMHMIFNSEERNKQRT